MVTHNESRSARVPFVEALAVHERRNPNHVAVICGETQLTRRELDRRSNQVARVLGGQGITSGQIVAIVLPNSVDVFITVVAAWKLGAIPLPLSHRMSDPELDSVLAVSDAATVVRSAIDASSEDDGPLVPVPLRWWKAMATGGSTGVPKVVLDQAEPVADPMKPQNFMQLDGTMLVAGPLYHSGPLINSVFGLLAGATVVTMERFDPEQALALVQRHRIDWAFLVPTMQHRIFRLGAEIRDRYDVSSLCAVVSSGGPFPAWLKAEMINWLGAETIQEAYGGTEQIGGTSISGTEALTKPGSVGRVRPGFEMRIRDDADADLSVHEIGQVWFRAVDGIERYRYLGRDDATAEWSSFGDLGWVDEDGYLYLADRRTDLIVTGGANVYPAEVEAAIESHPIVRSSAVIGLPHEDLGQQVHAIIDIADASTPGIDSDAMQRHLASLLTPYKIPRSFEFVRTSLRDEAGKVRRFALRAERLENHR